MNTDRLDAFAGDHVALRAVIRKIRAQPEDSEIQYKRLLVAVFRYLNSPRPMTEVEELVWFVYRVLKAWPLPGVLEVPDVVVTPVEAESMVASVIASEPFNPPDAPDVMIAVAETETPKAVKPPKRKKR